MSKTCAATTKSGKPCKNKARDNSDYCGTHKAFALATDTVAEATETITEKVEAVKNTVTEDVPVEETVIEESQALFDRLVNDLNGIVEEIKGNSNGIVTQIKERAENIPGATSVRDSKFVNDIQEQVQGKSPQELLDRDNLSNVWTILYENLQTGTESIRDTVTEGINHSVETAREMDTVNQFRERVNISSPQDLLSTSKWSEFAGFANETLQGQASSFRKWARTTRENTQDMSENATDTVTEIVEEV